MESSSVRFLAGAPRASTLSWADQTLLTEFSLQMRRYLRIDHGLVGTPATQGWSDWRAVPLNEQMFYQSPLARTSHTLAPINSKRHEKNAIQVLLDRDDDFLDHSFAVHADIQSSQLAPQLSLFEDEPTFVTENTEMSTFLEDSTVAPVDMSFMSSPGAAPAPSAGRSHANFEGPIMSVRAIPDAAHLIRLQPQTMTVNLVAGVISIPPTRTVNVRRGNYDMDIVEMVLGDDTKAGFTLSSWHTLTKAAQPSDPLRETLQALRPQDIVLVERLALSSFKGQVFGQSLNRRTSKNATNISVLCKSEMLRSAITYHNASLPPHLASKLQRVKDWVASFIGPGHRRDVDHSNPHNTRKRKHDATAQEEYLPPDSQT